MRQTKISLIRNFPISKTTSIKIFNPSFENKINIFTSPIKIFMKKIYHRKKQINIATMKLKLVIEF